MTFGGPAIGGGGHRLLETGGGKNERPVLSGAGGRRCQQNKKRDDQADEAKQSGYLRVKLYLIIYGVGRLAMAAVGVAEWKIRSRLARFTPYLGVGSWRQGRKIFL